MVKHLRRDPASVNAMKQNMCDQYSCVFYFIPTKFALKMLLKSLNERASAVKFQTS